MFDLRWIRDNPDAFDAGLDKRGMPPASPEILKLDEARRAAQTELQDMQARRNAASKEIGLAKRDGRDAQPMMDEVAALKESMTAAEERERDLQDQLHRLLSALPNLLSDDVPEGADEEANIEIRRWGVPETPEPARDHVALGEATGLIDFETAAGLSGARFVLLKGTMARLERALGQFFIDIHTREFGYTEVSPPLLVRDEPVFGTGQLPKFAEDLFRTTTGHWLIPTAEVPLTNMAANRIMEAEDLPMRLTALTPCFRSEAGSAGKDTRGMIRQHQFWKVELVSITRADQSGDEHERMTACAEEVLKRLELPYRVMVLCTGDTGFCAHKTYDIEVWLPGQDRYREISSCSNCGDFQARRMMARYRHKDDKQIHYAHTLNGSGVAVGRALIAVIENYQQPDGTIRVPDALKPYMGGLEIIGS